MIPTMRLVLLLTLMSFARPCTTQTHTTDRTPAVAGLFYPGSRAGLDSMLTELFSRAIPRGASANVVALVVPHAGYVYSGEVAASGYNVIDRDKQYDNIFIIGPSHSVGFEGASVYTAGNFLTPLGSVEVNRAIGEKLIRENPAFSDRRDAHAAEHSVEVQLPFLQHVLGGHIRIVPIVVGANTPLTCRSIARSLRPYLGGRNLFIVSTDFSHYPAYDDAVRIDRATAGAILSNSPDSLIATMERNSRSGVPNLVTSLCGWSAVLTLLYMTAGSTGHKFTNVEYKNSGDTPAGERERVVGYDAIAVSGENAEKEAQSFTLTPGEQQALLAIARRALEEYVARGRVPAPDEATLTRSLKTPCGTFVTLIKHHELRGCIGRFDAAEPLFHAVQLMAVASASQDYRFSPVKPSELKDLQIEISVITPMRRISSINELELGRQGLCIRKGDRSGTFLPQVARETGWTKEEFLGHCARDKAGIGWDGWKDAELYVYEALVFGEAGS